MKQKKTQENNKKEQIKIFDLKDRIKGEIINTEQLDHKTHY